nr:ANTAR domain-containing protein [Burkholderia sp. FERM BP-3421]
MALACHQHRRDDDYRRRIAQLEQRLASVRTLQDAKALLMQVHGISEEEAYQQIRSQAMEKRIAIHQLAEQIVQAHALLKRPGQASRGLPGRAARPSAASGPACTGTCRLRCGDARRAPARTARSR